MILMLTYELGVVKMPKGSFGCLDCLSGSCCVLVYVKNLGLLSVVSKPLYRILEHAEEST
jgi:hypothetical protein